MKHPLETHRAQAAAILESWGMPVATAATTAEILAWADLHGIESHGIAMLVEYDVRRKTRPINMRPAPCLLRDLPVATLMDADGGLGHAPARQAMQIAIDKARSDGVGMVSVRNSGHFGALGYYTTMAADAGLIGIATTSVFGIRVPPTGGKQARFGTDPWSFAAPSADGRHFVLDMATTTVASGRVRNKIVEGQPMPPGWGFDRHGNPTRDPREVMDGGFLSPLGGAADSAGYKGYGLATMVNILSSCLSGSTLITDPMHSRQPWGLDVGHFLMAFDPGLFREPAGFEADVARLSDTMRATEPADPVKPVLVAGDPERAVRDVRLRDGIPIGPGLARRLRSLALETGAAWLLTPVDLSEAASENIAGLS